MGCPFKILLTKELKLRMVKGNLRAINIPNNSVDQVMRHQIQQDIVVLYVDILPVICSVSECITLLVSQAVPPPRLICVPPKPGGNHSRKPSLKTLPVCALICPFFFFKQNSRWPSDLCVSRQRNF